MTLLCVPIFVQNPSQAQRDIALAAEAGANLVELRLDDLTDEQEVRQIVQASLLPCILTCRPTWEGGRSMLGDEERFALLEAGSVEPARYIDLELKAIERAPRYAGPTIRLIISSHDFAGRPDKLHNLILRMNEARGDIKKIVWTARTVRDNLEAFDL